MSESSSFSKITDYWKQQLADGGDVYIVDQEYEEIGRVTFWVVGMHENSFLGIFDIDKCEFNETGRGRIDLLDKIHPGAAANILIDPDGTAYIATISES
jgi:hypothetical protein